MFCIPLLSSIFQYCVYYCLAMEEDWEITEILSLFTKCASTMHVTLIWTQTLTSSLYRTPCHSYYHRWSNNPVQNIEYMQFINNVTYLWTSQHLQTKNVMANDYLVHPTVVTPFVSQHNWFAFLLWRGSCYWQVNHWLKHC